MRIALLGDLHLGKSLYGVDLSPYIKCCMWDFVEFCRQTEADMVVQLGDVFDRPTPTEEHRKIVSQWCNEFTRMGIPLFILVGNHDVMARKESPSALQYLKAGARSSNPWIVDRPMLLPMDGAVKCLFLPFPSPGIYSASEYSEDTESAISDYVDIVFAHLNVVGAKLGNQDYVYRGGAYHLPKLGSKVFCGHIHTPQQLGDICIVGAAERLRCDEAGQYRYFGLVTIDKEEVSYKRLLRHTALDLVVLEIDASSNNRGGPPSTDDVISDIARTEGYTRAVIKITPFVDERSIVDWGVVRNWLYSDGAEHVHLAPPVNAGKKRDEKSKQKYERDPEKAATTFIKGRIKDKKEQADLMDLFLQTLKELD